MPPRMKGIVRARHNRCLIGSMWIKLCRILTFPSYDPTRISWSFSHDRLFVIKLFEIKLFWEESLRLRLSSSFCQRLIVIRILLSLLILINFFNCNHDFLLNFLPTNFYTISWSLILKARSFLYEQLCDTLLSNCYSHSRLNSNKFPSIDDTTLRYMYICFHFRGPVMYAHGAIN